MSPEHDDYLCRTYPEIFRDRYADMKTTAMCWGFECPDAWFDLIDNLCHTIQQHINNRKFNGKDIQQVVAVQVKEKYNGLRFYYDGGDDYIAGAVDLAESLSYKIKQDTYEST